MNTNLNSAEAEGFITEAAGPSGLFGVFEDDGETGYLYLYEPDGQGVTNHLRVYVRTPDLNVKEDDVRVEWSTDLSKCGVRIWGKMRGIIDIVSKQEGRVLLETRSTPGIGDAKWLEGFDAE
jgi:hypothetical protein